MRFSRRHPLHDALLFGALLLEIPLCCPPVTAQDAAQEQSKSAPADPPQENRSEAVSASVDEFQLFLNADAQEPLEVKRVFQWADPVLPEGENLCLLYLHEGRPVASCKIYQTSRSIVHTFISMSDQPLVARAEDDIVWTPPESGLKFRQLTGVVPASSPARRRIQMKGIASEFSAITDDAEATRQQAVPELRLLSTPLYRYPEDLKSDDGVVDGAVFAFVVGSGNPQVLMVLEAVREEEQTHWVYAFSRRTLAQLEVSHLGQKVWNVPFFPRQRMNRLEMFCKINLPIADQ